MTGSNVAVMRDGHTHPGRWPRWSPRRKFDFARTLTGER